MVKTSDRTPLHPFEIKACTDGGVIRQNQAILSDYNLFQQQIKDIQINALYSENHQNIQNIDSFNHRFEKTRDDDYEHVALKASSELSAGAHRGVSSFDIFKTPSSGLSFQRE